MAKKKVVKKAKSSQKSFLIIFLIVFVVLTGVFAMRNSNQTSPTEIVATNPTAFDFGNQRIMLNNQELTFVNGTFQGPDTTYGKHTAMVENRSVSPSGTRAAAILVDSPGGSGTFYYLVGAMLKKGKETYSEPLLLGDRIKIVSVSVADPATEDNGVISVQFLDRPANAAMVVEPSIKTTTKYAFQDNGNLVSVLH